MPGTLSLYKSFDCSYYVELYKRNQDGMPILDQGDLVSSGFFIYIMYPIYLLTNPHTDYLPSSYHYRSPSTDVIIFGYYLVRMEMISFTLILGGCVYY